MYNYCTGSARDAGTPAGSRGGSGDDKSGATFVGEELYARVATLLKRHMKELLRGAESRAGPALLAYYTAEWDRFTLAMKHLNHIFNYLVCCAHSLSASTLILTQTHTHRTGTG